MTAPNTLNLLPSMNAFSSDRWKGELPPRSSKSGCKFLYFKDHLKSAAPQLSQQNVNHFCEDFFKLEDIYDLLSKYMLFKHLHEMQTNRFCDLTQRKGMEEPVLHTQH